MIYDFETLVSRKNTGSGKWDEMTKEHPNLPGKRCTAFRCGYGAEKSRRRS